MNERRQNTNSAPKLSRRNLLRGATACVGAVSVGGLWKSTSIQIRRQTLYLPRWDAEGFRMVFMSDLHVNSVRQFKRGMEAIRIALREKVDAIVLGGDFIDSHQPEAISHLMNLGSALHQANCPVLGIFGNHDLHVGENQITDILRESPIIILRNHSYDLQGVSFTGLDDAMYGSPDPSLLTDEKLSKSRICLWHEPDTVDHTPSEASVQFSGHSHGGEICLPGGIPIHTPEWAKNYTGGLYSSTRAPLYVSKGIATVGPFRMYCPPEMSVLTIRSSGGTPAYLTV